MKSDEVSYDLRPFKFFICHVQSCVNSDCLVILFRKDFVFLFILTLSVFNMWHLLYCFHEFSFDLFCFVEEYVFKSFWRIDRFPNQICDRKIGRAKFCTIYHHSTNRRICKRRFTSLWRYGFQVRKFMRAIKIPANHFDSGWNSLTLSSLVSFTLESKWKVHSCLIGKWSLCSSIVSLKY